MTTVGDAGVAGRRPVQDELLVAAGDGERAVLTGDLVRHGGRPSRVPPGPLSSAASTSSTVRPPHSWSPVTIEQGVRVLRRRSPGRPATAFVERAASPAASGWPLFVVATSRRRPPPRRRGRSRPGPWTGCPAPWWSCRPAATTGVVLVALALGALLEHLLVGEQPEQLVAVGRGQRGGVGDVLVAQALRLARSGRPGCPCWPRWWSRPGWSGAGARGCRPAATSPRRRRG